jgi:hypothetical protein
MTQAERRALWTQRIAEQQASGASAAAWCAQWDVPLAAFYTWRRRLTAPPAATPAWTPLLPAEDTAGLTLRVGAVTIDVPAGFDPQVLAAVLAVVAPRC